MTRKEQKAFTGPDPELVEKYFGMIMPEIMDDIKLGHLPLHRVLPTMELLQSRIEQWRVDHSGIGVKSLRDNIIYYIGNPSAWEDALDEKLSEMLRLYFMPHNPK